MHWLIMQRGNAGTLKSWLPGYQSVININLINRADAKSITKEKSRKDKEMEFLTFATNTRDLDLEVNTSQSSNH